MKLSQLKSLGHNIADSLGSGMGLLVGVYEMDVYGDAMASPNGRVQVNFLRGTCIGGSSSLSGAVRAYRNALPRLCERHSIDLTEIARLEATYGVDRVYGRHFTVTVETSDGRFSLACVSAVRQ